MAHKIAVSVSYGDTDPDSHLYTKSVHMLTYSDVELTEEEAKILQDGIVQFCCMIRHARTQKEVLGVYKEEYPSSATRQ